MNGRGTVDGESPEQILQRIGISWTLDHLRSIAPSFSLDVSNHEDVRNLLCNLSLRVVFALDDERIRFDNEDDKWDLHGLLAVSMLFALGGRFDGGAS